MPVHNRGRYVEQACTSILNQSFRDFELIVIDDGSTDDSVRRLRVLAARDPRLVLIVRENRGLISSRNELLTLSRAPLLAWMDSDDYALPERLMRQVECFDADPDLVCVGSAVLEIDPDGEPLGRILYPAEHPHIERDLRRGGAMRFPSTMMKRQSVIEVGGFREPFRMGEDLDLFLRLSEMGRLANLSTILLHYRLHPENVSGSFSTHWIVYRDTILALAKERREGGKDRLQRGEGLVLPSAPEGPSKRRYWDSHRDWARQALASGHLKVARKHAFKALALAPHRLRSWKLAARVCLETSLGLRRTGDVLQEAEKSR